MEFWVIFPATSIPRTVSKERNESSTVEWTLENTNIKISGIKSVFNQYNKMKTEREKKLARELKFSLKEATRQNFEKKKMRLFLLDRHKGKRLEGSGFSNHALPEDFG